MIYITNTAFLNGTIGAQYTTDNPIIFWNSVLDNSEFSATYENVTNRPASNMWNPSTASVWEGDSYSGVSTTFTQYIFLENANDDDIDYIAIGKHNFGDGGYEITLQESTDGGTIWTDISTTKTPTNNDPFIEFFDSRDSGDFRIRIEKTDTDVIAPIVAHVKAGLAFVLQRRIYDGHMPANLSREVRKTVNVSESGQYLGQVVMSSFHTASCQQENNTPAFARSDVVPFIAHVNGHDVNDTGAPATFFWAWRPTTYPDEIVYAWTSDNIKLENQSGDSSGGRMKWGFNMQAVV